MDAMDVKVVNASSFAQLETMTVVLEFFEKKEHVKKVNEEKVQKPRAKFSHIMVIRWLRMPI